MCVWVLGCWLNKARHVIINIVFIRVTVGSIRDFFLLWESLHDIVKKGTLRCFTVDIVIYTNSV